MRSVDPLWRFARRVSSIALRASGDYRPPRSLSMAGSVGKVNGVLSRYTLTSFDDYERIEDEDLRDVHRIVRSLIPPK
jgi:hypothetical protein